MSTEQSETDGRFPGCPSLAEIDAVASKLEKTDDPVRRREILSSFLGGLPAEIELVNQPAPSVQPRRSGTTSAV